MYKAVIFDLDGTLLDSLDDIVLYLNKTLSRYSLPTVSRAKAIGYIGNGARELVRLAIGDSNADRLEEILNYYRTLYANSDNALARLYDGEEEALKRLKSAGIKIAILSNKPHGATVRANEIFFKRFAFDAVQGQAEGVPLKPDPQAVYTLLDTLGVSKQDCLFVGDGETDVLTAENAGLKCASVLWGYRTKEQLSAVGATDFFENYSQLADFILK